MTNKEYNSIIESKRMIHIEYETPYSKGTMEIKYALYQRNLKKISRLFKDATILKYEEY